MKKLYFLIGLIIIVTSCEKDDSLIISETVSKDSEKFKIIQLTQNELKTDKRFLKELEKIERYNSQIQTNEAKSKDDFIVNTSTAVYIESGDYKSYTFPIKRYKGGGNLENLLFSLNAKGKYNTYLVRYNFSPEELKTLDKEALSLKEVHYRPINLDLEELIGGKSSKQTTTYERICIEEWKYTPDEGQLGAEHLAGWYLVSKDCRWITVESDSDSGGDTGGVPGGSTGGGGGDTGGGTYTPCDGLKAEAPCEGEEPVIITGPVPYEYSTDEINFNNFKSALNSQEKIWLQGNSLFENVIFSYLKQNNFSNEALTFSITGLRIKMDGGKVDFNNEILKDPSFVGTKAECVLDELISSGNNIFRKVSEAFTGNRSKYKILFTTYNDQSDSADARAALPNANKIIEIRFNLARTGLYNNSNAIDLASTILHETIHAELHRIKLSNNAGPNPLPTAQFQLYLKMWEYYQNPLLTINETATATEHYYMAGNYINVIAQGLRDFDKNSHPLNNYKYFAWHGLESYGKAAGYITQAELLNLANLTTAVLNDSYFSPCDN